MQAVKVDSYQVVTNKIVALMEEHGTGWTKPWIGKGGSGARPVSVTTGKAYTGINPLLLWDTPFQDARWGTYKAWSDKGGQVRKGEKGTHIVFFKALDIRDKKTGEDKIIPFLRLIPLFNAEQIEGIAPLDVREAPESPAEADERVQAAIAFAINTGGDIRITAGSDRAYYSPVVDKVVVPSIEDFVGTATSSAQESFAATLLHEIIHWTGHAKRLARVQTGSFGSEDYAKEELVAEIGATFLCADLGITSEPRADHAQYLNAWIKELKHDKRLIVQAASKAGKAAEYLHSLQPGAAEEEHDEDQVQAA